MFSLIESKAEIARAQRKLEASFRRDFNRQATKDIGYPGAVSYTHLTLPTNREV